MKAKKAPRKRTAKAVKPETAAAAATTTPTSTESSNSTESTTTVTENAAETSTATTESSESASTSTSTSGFESVESLEAEAAAAGDDEEEEEEELDPLSDEALGITPEMSEEEADALRREAKRKQIKAENYEKKKMRLAESLSKSKERLKVKLHELTLEKVKYFFRDGWNDIVNDSQKKNRVIFDKEEVDRQRQDILNARSEAEKMKEEAEKEGKPLKTELMNVENYENLWAQIADLLKDAPLIESLLEMSNKVKDSKFGETITYAAEDMREKWNTSQHPFIYKMSAVYDELFAESDMAKTVREVQRTDPTFFEEALRDEMKRSIVPSMMKAWVNQDTATLRLVMNDHAFAQVNSVIQMQQAEGLEMDKTIMEVRDVELEVR